jgi:photosystem II stability/assembly factor-like uncharacterized protein
MIRTSHMIRRIRAHSFLQGGWSSVAARLATIAASAFVCILLLSKTDALPTRSCISSDASMRESEFEREGLTPGLTWFARQRLFGNPTVASAALLSAAMEYRLALSKAAAWSGSVQWSPLGPGNMAGRVRAIAIDPANESIVYAGSASGGVFKSTNKGKEWTALTDQAPALSIGAVAVDPRRTGTVYAGTGEPVIFLSKAITLPTFGGVGVMKSTDAGTNWFRVPWSGSAAAVTRILVHPVVSDTLLVATRQNLYKSPDGGATWKAGMLNGVVTDIRYKEANPSAVFAALGNDLGAPENGVYRSDAGGDRYTWKKLGVNFPRGDSTGRIMLATTPAAPNLLYALVARPITASMINGYWQYGVTDKDFFALMRSSDAGDTWERFDTNLPADLALGQAFYDFCIAVSPANAEDIYVGGIELFHSQDGGHAFFQISQGGKALHIDQHCIAFSPTGAEVFVGNDGGVYRSTNTGLEWSRLAGTLASMQFYSVALDRTDTDRRFGGTQDNGLLSQQMQTTDWTTLFGDIDAGSLAVDSTAIYAMSTVFVYPYRTTNGGQTWSPLNAGFSGDDRPNWLQPLLLHPTDRSRLYTATQYVYEARNANLPDVPPVWRAISPALPGTPPYYESVITTLAVPNSRGTWMYAGSGSGKVFRCEDISATVPAWIDISNGLPMRWITRVGVHPSDPMHVFVTLSGLGSGHVFESTDAGATWADISANLPDIPVNALAIAQSGNMAMLFVGTDAGVWQKASDGAWIPVGTGLPNVVVYDLAIDREQRLVAATHGRGMWISQAVVPVEFPTEYADNPVIVGLFPHPVVAGSRLTVTVLPSSTPTELSVFDMSGRERFTQRLPSSLRIIPLDLGALPEGVYFVRLSRAGTSTVRKFVLAR